MFTSSTYKHQFSTTTQDIWVLNSNSNQWVNSGNLLHCLPFKSMADRFLDI